jgi:integrase
MVEGFLLWATRHGHVHNVKMPPAKRGSLHALTQERRIELVHTLLTDDQLDPGDRVIGLLLLLYAQPVSRITQLRLDDVTVDGADVAIRFDTELVPLPAPLGAVLLALLDRRPNMATAANPRSAWLFPGGMPGDPIHEETVLQRLRRLAIEVRPGRNATLEQLVQAVPAVVLADMLGYKASTVHRRAGEGATDWATYAATKSSRATSPISAR